MVLTSAVSASPPLAGFPPDTNDEWVDVPQPPNVSSLTASFSQLPPSPSSPQGETDTLEEAFEGFDQVGMDDVADERDPGCQFSQKPLSLMQRATKAGMRLLNQGGGGFGLGEVYDRLARLHTVIEQPASSLPSSISDPMPDITRPASDADIPDFKPTQLTLGERLAAWRRRIDRELKAVRKKASNAMAAVMLELPFATQRTVRQGVGRVAGATLTGAKAIVSIGMEWGPPTLSLCLTYAPMVTIACALGILPVSAIQTAGLAPAALITRVVLGNDRGLTRRAMQAGLRTLRAMGNVSPLAVGAVMEWARRPRTSETRPTVQGIVEPVIEEGRKKGWLSWGVNRLPNLISTGADTMQTIVTLCCMGGLGLGLAELMLGGSAAMIASSLTGSTLGLDRVAYLGLRSMVANSRGLGPPLVAYVASLPSVQQTLVHTAVCCATVVSGYFTHLANSFFPPSINDPEPVGLPGDLGRAYDAVNSD